jgi:hypothetical protein
LFLLPVGLTIGHSGGGSGKRNPTARLYGRSFFFFLPSASLLVPMSAVLSIENDLFREIKVPENGPALTFFDFFVAKHLLH